MGTARTYQCPLCKSPISREIFDRVLRIDETRRQEATRERERIKRALADIERQREQIAQRAAAAERKKVFAEAAAAQARLEKQIRELHVEARRQRQLYDRALATQAGKAKRESASREKRLLKQIEQARRTADAERRRAGRDAEVRIKAAKEAAQQPHLRAIEKLNGQLRTLEERRHREVEGLNRAITALKEKADAHEHAHFGPEGEEQLVAALQQEFPRDVVERRRRGGDVIHTVLDAGEPLGKIVYECKRTATWQLAFTRQLKKAMEAHDTKYGLLVSRKLPGKRAGCCTANKVLVVEPHLAVQIAGILRDAIVALGRARMSEHGTAAKTAEIYRYLQSDDFSNAIARIDDKVKELRTTLEKEKSNHDGWWRSREQHYATILREASGIDSRVQEILTGRPRKVTARIHRMAPAAVGA